MPQKLIDGVRTRQLAVHADERGRLMEMLRRDDEMFMKFGQVYLTTAYPGVVKAWHYHRNQVDHFVVVSGMMKVVLYDARDKSPTRGTVNEFFMGEFNPLILQIPAGVYHGFKCISEREALVVNIPTEVYDREEPDEHRLDPHSPDIPYDWSRKDG
jgi:dTDP-4-dehydrorhamnose 3,5-epimerase